MSARMNIFKADMFTSSEGNTLASICLNSKHVSTWTQQNIDYKIKGITKRESNFDDCYLSVKKTVENKLNAPVELRKKKIFAFSFYFDRLSSANLLSGTGGTLNVNKILERAKKGLSLTLTLFNYYLF